MITKQLSNDYFARFTVSAAVPCTLYRTNNKGASTLVAAINEDGELGQYVVCPATAMLEWLQAWQLHQQPDIPSASGLCRGCGLILDCDPNHGLADGCPCNSPRGINHGLVPVNICTCDVCDPAKTGAVRNI